MALLSRPKGKDDDDFIPPLKKKPKVQPEVAEDVKGMFPSLLQTVLSFLL